MPAPPKADRITGNTRHRVGLFGKLILEVEEVYVSAYAGIGGANPTKITSTRWRDARLSDLYLIQWHERQKLPRIMPTTGSGGRKPKRKESA